MQGIREQLSHIGVTWRNREPAMNNSYNDYVEIFVLTVVVAGCYFMIAPM
jgi:hypothetical protein